MENLGYLVLGLVFLRVIKQTRLKAIQSASVNMRFRGHEKTEKLCMKRKAKETNEGIASGLRHGSWNGLICRSLEKDRQKLQKFMKVFLDDTATKRLFKGDRSDKTTTALDKPKSTQGAE